jgi:hypothetical protein
MSDYNSNNSGRSQGRGGRGGRRRSGPNPNRNHSYSSDQGNFRVDRKKTPAPTGFQKFLSLITFGLYKPAGAAKPRPASKPSAPREPGPIARGDREAKQAARKESRPPRQAPISTEVTNERLYVGNLSYDASESDLFELFSGSGNVKNCEVVVNSRTQRSKGFAFVTMMTVDEAKKAVADLNAKDFMGRPLVVGGAKPMAPREERGSSSQVSDEDAITPPVEDEEEAEKVNA